MVRYGNSAWSAQWASLSSNVTAPPFTTTPAATPIPSSELVKPPPLPFEIGYDSDYRFPEEFVFGFSSSAVQGEGASMSEGRGPSLAERLFNGSSIASLSYYLYKQDIARMAAAGVQTYSFTTSWSRILPFAVPGSPVNQQGIDHYNDLINTLLEYGITPIVTLTHFDTPVYYYTKTSFK
jgi:beta-glucosidase/6-phospho-beta-glucosidase/beta-galactosidase